MKYLKKSMAIVLTFALMLTLSLPMVAFENENQSTNYSTVELLEIEAERDMLYDLVREQLISQDAEEYFDMFKIVADETIAEKYFPETIESRASQSIYASDGGYTYGENFYIDMHISYYDKRSTTNLYENRDSRDLENSLAALTWFGIEAMLGSFGLIGVTAGFSNWLSDKWMWEPINEGSGRAYILSTYDKQEGKQIDLIWQWSNYPYMSLPDSSYDNVDYGVFTSV